jgi:hypothetical protein
LERSDGVDGGERPATERRYRLTPARSALAEVGTGASAIGSGWISAGPGSAVPGLACLSVSTRVRKLATVTTKTATIRQVSKPIADRMRSRSRLLNGIKRSDVRRDFEIDVGKRTRVPHFGHFAFRPAFRFDALRHRLHDGHATRIDTMGALAEGDIDHLSITDCDFDHSHPLRSVNRLDRSRHGRRESQAQPPRQTRSSG